MFAVFLAALIWLRGMKFFQFKFLRGLFLWGIGGMLFYLLLPAIAVSGYIPVTFWQALKFNLSQARQKPTKWNFSPWSDFRTYMDLSLAAALDELRRAAPSTRCGC